MEPTITGGENEDFKLLNDLDLIISFDCLLNLNVGFLSSCSKR